MSSLPKTVITSKDKIYYSDIITDEYYQNLVQYNENWALTGSTGSGKSSIIEELLLRFPEYHFYILSPRSRLKEQQLTDFEPYTNTNLINFKNASVMTIQSFIKADEEGFQKEVELFKDRLEELDHKVFLIVDEVHCLTEDSTFNTEMINFYHFYLQVEPYIPTVLLSASGNLIFDLIKKERVKVVELNIKGKYDFVNHLYAYHRPFIRYGAVETYAKSGLKSVQFVETYKEMERTIMQMKKRGITYCVQITQYYQQQLDEETDEEKLKTLQFCIDEFEATKHLFHRNEKGYTFDTETLISTKVLDVGCNLITDNDNNDLGAIFVANYNFASAQQEFGRYRHTANTNTKVDFYYYVMREESLKISINNVSRKVCNENNKNELVKATLNHQLNCYIEMQRLIEKGYSYLTAYLIVARKYLFDNQLKFEFLSNNPQKEELLLDFINKHINEWLTKELQLELKNIINSDLSVNKQCNSVSKINNYLSDYEFTIESKEKRINGVKSTYWIIK